jgi:putative peptidoglycan lipid II flippase
LPAATALLLLAAPILSALFQYGALTVRDVSMSGLSLSALALGLPAFMLIKVLATAFYSRQDTGTPVRIGIIAMVANMVLNLLFVLPLHLFWQIGHMGLALATTGAAYLNAGLLLRGLVQRGIYRPQAELLADLRRILVATVAMAAGLLVCLPWLADFALHGWATRGLRLGVVCASGVAVYFGVLLAQRPAFLAHGLRRTPPAL